MRRIPPRTGPWKFDSSVKVFIRISMVLLFFCLLSQSACGWEQKAITDSTTPDISEPGIALQSTITSHERETTPASRPSITPSVQKSQIEPESEHQVMASDLMPITVRNAAAIQEVATIPAQRVLFLAFSPDNSQLITASQNVEGKDWVVEAWDTGRGDKLFDIEAGPSFYFSPDSSHMATITNGNLQIWNTYEGSLSNQTSHHEVLALSPDWQTIATIPHYDPDLNDSEVQLIDRPTNAVSTSIHVQGTVVDAQFSPDGQFLAIITGGLTSETNIYSLNNTELVKTIQEVERPAFSNDGRFFVGIVDPEQVITLFALPEFKPIGDLNLKGMAPAQHLAFSTDGSLLASTSGDQVQLWDTANGELLLTLATQSGDLTFSGNGNLLATSDFGGIVRLWGIPQSQ